MKRSETIYSIHGKQKGFTFVNPSILYLVTFPEGKRLYQACMKTNLLILSERAK